MDCLTVTWYIHMFSNRSGNLDGQEISHVRPIPHGYCSFRKFRTKFVEFARTLWCWKMISGCSCAEIISSMMIFNKFQICIACQMIPGWTIGPIKWSPTIQTKKKISWIASGTMSFVLKKDFVEDNNVNCVNLIQYSWYNRLY